MLLNPSPLPPSTHARQAKAAKTVRAKAAKAAPAKRAAATTQIKSTKAQGRGKR